MYKPSSRLIRSTKAGRPGQRCAGSVRFTELLYVAHETHIREVDYSVVQPA